jgi:hypothetical protein
MTPLISLAIRRHFVSPANPRSSQRRNDILPKSTIPIILTVLAAIAAPAAADAAPVLPILRYLADRPWLHDELDVVVEGLGKAVVWAPDRSEVRVVGCDQRVLAVVKIAGRSPANHTLDQDWLFFQHGPPMHGVGGGMGGMY